MVARSANVVAENIYVDTDYLNVYGDIIPRRRGAGLAEAEVGMENVVSFWFRVSGLSVLPFWLLMWLRPRARITRRVMASPFVVLGPLLLYATLVLPRLWTLLPLVARPELARIAPLLGTPLGATIAWAHFLALDLFAGRCRRGALSQGAGKTPTVKVSVGELSP
jgi:hypothetical protein